MMEATYPSSGWAVLLCHTCWCKCFSETKVSVPATMKISSFRGLRRTKDAPYLLMAKQQEAASLELRCTPESERSSL
jgi:hypothetical protein